MTAGLSPNLATLCGEQNWRCCYCGCRFSDVTNADDAPSVDHVIPLSTGGRREWLNEVAACRKCNAVRGATDAFEFFVTRQRNEPPAAFTKQPLRVRKARRQERRNAAMNRADRAGREQLADASFMQRLAGAPATLADIWPANADRTHSTAQQEPTP